MVDTKHDMVLQWNSDADVVCVLVQDKLSAELDRLNHDIFLMQEQQFQQMYVSYIVYIYIYILYIYIYIYIYIYCIYRKKCVIFTTDWLYRFTHMTLYVCCWTRYADMLNVRY